MTNNDSHPYYPRVTLKTDDGFVGYSFGRYYDADGNDTGCLMVSVSQPGSTDLRGCVHLPADQLVVLG